MLHVLASRDGSWDSFVDTDKIIIIIIIIFFFFLISF